MAGVPLDRFYLSWARAAQDEEDLAVFFASMQEEGQVADTAWPRIERVNQAIAGWLPDDLKEMRNAQA